jgi:multiple sugar transport system permease protein
MAFDPQAEAFKPLGQYQVSEKGTPRVLRSRNDTLLILSSRGLTFYDPQSGSFPKFLTHPDVLPGEARNIMPLADGTLAMTLDASAFLFDPAGDTVITWLDEESGLGRSTISTLAVSGNTLYIGSGQGAYSIRRDSTQNLLVALQVPTFPSEFIAQKGDLAQVEVTSLGLASDGSLWMGGASGGLFHSARAGTSESPLGLRLPEPSPYFHWRNYIDLWRNIDFGLYLWNSLVVCFWVMILSMIFASLGGYALARYNFPGRNFFGHAVLATQMVPGLLLLLPIYLMYVNFTEATGLMVKGTYWGLIITYAAYFTPFSIWILRGFFASIPKELEEAALIDGCGPFHAFFRIILPSALPGIIATGVYVFLSAWDELMFAWVLTGEKTYTIPVGIRLFVGNFQNRYDLMMAAATVATIPVMALFFLMQRHIVAGLTAGAVKD